MNQSNTHRKPIQPTQTNDDSDADDSDFPPCRVGNSPPLFCHSPVAVPTRRSRYLRAAENSSQRQHTGKSLGRMNVINTVDATPKVFIYSLVHVAMLMLNVNVRLIVQVLFTENVCSS
jgi:hypothetical protein